MPSSDLDDMPRSLSLPRSTPAPVSTTSTVLNHTIPPFYACYLLRSFNKARGGTYIGSTPDPPRRFKQHSGEIKGGAWKTQRGRPWEMEGIVYGFPSKLQALQFEWAWQNPHASRHLHAPRKEGDGAEGGDAAEKPVAQFPKSALSNRPLTKIQVLQFMLTVPPWRSFNLKVLLFSLHAKSWWDEARRLGPVARTEAGVKKWKKERLAAGTIGDDPWDERGKVLDATTVQVREEGVDGMRLVRAGKKLEEDAVERIRVDDHDFFDPHWNKWTPLAEPNAPLSCTICDKPVDVEDHLSFFLCTSSTSTACTAAYHLPCLSRHFLSPASASASSTASTRSAHLSTLPSGAPPRTRSAPLVPTHGTCPSCGGPLHWVDLVRGLYRRKEEEEGTRKKRTFQKGSKDPQAKKRTRKGTAGPASSQPAKRKGKGKAAAVDSGSEGEERFDFDEDEDARSDERDGSDADSVDLDAEEEEEQERSWAQSVAAEGALVDVLAEEMDVDDWAADPPSAAAPAPAPLSPKKRGRPPKPAAASPPRAAVKAAPRRRASPVKKKAAPVSLTSTFASSKASLSTSTAAAASKSRKPRTPVPLPSDSDDDLLPPPSKVGLSVPQGAAAAKKVPGKKKVAHVELSD